MGGTDMRSESGTTWRRFVVAGVIACVGLLLCWIPAMSQLRGIRAEREAFAAGLLERGSVDVSTLRDSLQLSPGLSDSQVVAAGIVGLNSEWTYFYGPVVLSAAVVGSVLFWMSGRLGIGAVRPEGPRRFGAGLGSVVVAVVGVVLCIAAAAWWQAARSEGRGYWASQMYGMGAIRGEFGSVLSSGEPAYFDLARLDEVIPARLVVGHVRMCRVGAVFWVVAWPLFVVAVKRRERVRVLSDGKGG